MNHIKKMFSRINFDEPKNALVQVYQGQEKHGSFPSIAISRTTFWPLFCYQQLMPIYAPNSE